MPHHFVDLGSVSSLVAIGTTIVAIVAALNRQRLYRHLKRLGSSLHKTSRIVSENEHLTELLEDSEQRNIEWAAAFQNVDNLRQAISDQLERLTLEIAELRKFLSAQESLIHLLQLDRDALLTWGRLLVGQLFTDGKLPAYTAPSLQSIITHPEHITTKEPAPSQPPPRRL
jgi:hypothetical protein